MREGIYIIDIFPHTGLLKNLKFYPYRPLKPCGDGGIDVKKIRKWAIKVLKSKAFGDLEEILKAIFLFVKYLVGTYQVQIIAGCVDTMDILGGVNRIDNIRLLII